MKLNIKRKNGFNLVELMITVAIIGVLSSIALPAYKDYMLRSQATEGISSLASMRVKMEQYFQDNRTYVGACAAGTIAPLPTNLKYFALSCSNLGVDTYTITATAATLGFTYKMDESNTRSTTSVPSGWSLGSTPNACWVNNKNGQCQ